jgi:hypothetical protein
MTMEKLGVDDLFDRPLTYPDLSARKRFSRLVGIDDAKSRLTKMPARGAGGKELP